MNIKECGAWSALCLLVIAGAWSAPASAQMPEVKEKPPMYSYVANWSIPRARWADMDKQLATNAKIFDKAIASGALVGYGNDAIVVHQADGQTHDNWFSAMSTAALLGVLDELQKSGSSTAPVLISATKHTDNLFVSRFYNWKAGSLQGAYTRGAMFKLKADAPNDALERLSKAFIVPLLEKQLAAGAIQEYEVDTETVHTEDPATFWVFYIAPTAEGLDKVTAALGEAMRANALAGLAFGSMLDFTAHRDYLARTNATYK